MVEFKLCLGSLYFDLRLDHMFSYLIIRFHINVLFLKYLCCFPQDMGHLPETKIQKFMHEPANVGRTVQNQVYVPEPIPTTVAIAAPPPREGTSHYG